MDKVQFPGRGKVAIVRTTPETVLEDYARLMSLVDYGSILPADKTTLLKINISWQTWYPACSTTPWQLEGVIKVLQGDGYDLVGVHNDTVVVDTSVGEVNNKQRYVTDKYGVPCTYIYQPEVKWVPYKTKRPYLVLDQDLPRRRGIPEPLIGQNIVQLPTVKTHVFTTITGAMKNAFGGLLGPQAPLDPQRDPRDGGGPADDPAGDPPRSVRRDGRHLCRRRPRTARDALAREEHPAGVVPIRWRSTLPPPCCRASIRWSCPSCGSHTSWVWAWPIRARSSSWVMWMLPPSGGTSSRRTPSPAQGRRRSITAP